MDEEILYPIQLLDVRLFEAVVERIVPEESEASSETEAEQEPTPLLTVSAEIVRHEESRSVSAFLTIEIEGPNAEQPEFRLSVTLEGLFEAQVDFDEIDETTWQEFEATSSITLVWPYAREVMHSFSRRMRVDLPVLPTLNRLAMQPTREPES